MGRNRKYGSTRQQNAANANRNPACVGQSELLARRSLSPRRETQRVVGTNAGKC